MATLALLSDFPEENWPSMEVVAAGLESGLKEIGDPTLQANRVCGTYRHRAGRLSRHGAARNVDRLWNRMIVYPRYAHTLREQFDLFHVTDHSYSQLVHALPAERTGVFCHDLDTFRSLFDPVGEPRSRWFKAMAKRILSGMQQAAVVFHSTDPVRDEILRHQLIDPAKLVKAPYGVSELFTPTPIDGGTGGDEDLPAVVPRDRPFLLHVGSNIPRKRMDVLLDVFASVKKIVPELMLVKVGPEWTEEQQAQIERLGIREEIVHLVVAQRREIAACYRHAAAALMTSEAEGFGLPVAEGLACGAVVVCSDIPVLREVGADAAIYAPLADIEAWTIAIERILKDPSTAPNREVRLARAATFTWRHHAEVVAGAYRALLR